MNGKITKADSKHIYLNNIKGQHQYWKNVGKQIDKGEAFYRKTRKTSTKLANNPLGVIISPIPTIVGFVGYTGATVLSPLTTLTIFLTIETEPPIAAPILACSRPAL